MPGTPTAIPIGRFLECTPAKPIPQAVAWQRPIMRQAMIETLLQALVASNNEAADDLLLQALAVGNESERGVVLGALLKRRTVRGLSGVIGAYHSLAEPIQKIVIENVKAFHHAIRECGRSDEADKRKSALHLIAQGRQGKLAYILSENLHDPNDLFSKAAVEALVSLARWIATETQRLHAGVGFFTEGQDELSPDVRRDYQNLIEQRPEIEAAVARAMDVHRGRHGPELLRAALLLSDSPGSKTMAILHTAKHGGQSPMVRRLQQPPAAEHVGAFLLGASHGQLRSHFGTVFSHVDEAPVLDSLLRKTHWLKDNQLQLCVHQVTRGKWCTDVELVHDITRREPIDAARAGEWVAASGLHDIMQDERLERIRAYVGDDFGAKVRLLRIAIHRPRRGASVLLLKAFLTDTDERIARMAARDIVRRKPQDHENMLLQLMTNARNRYGGWSPVRSGRPGSTSSGKSLTCSTRPPASRRARRC